MSWSLDWFAAEKLAKAGAQIRRAGWTTQFLTYASGVWLLTTGGTARVVQITDFLYTEFVARQWTDQPVQTPPPIPGYAS